MIISTKYLITGDGKTVLTDKAVYIGEDGKIGKIAPKEELLKEFPQEEVKEYGDATLLPGLMDMHAHLAYGYSQPDSFNYGTQLIMLYALQHAQAAFERGITTVRDMSSAHGVCKNLKLAEKKGFIVIPRIVHTDTGICMTGGHAWDEVEEADGPWAIRKEIRKQVRDGAEWVKILTTNRESYPELTQEELDAAVDECHRRGIKCGVHAGTNPGIQMCIDAGFDTIEHGTFMTLDHAKQMAEKGIAWTPTIMAYTYLYELCKENIEKNGDAPVSDPVMQKEMENYEFFEPAYKAYRDHFKEFYDTGVTVLAGTDMVMYHSPLLPLPPVWTSHTRLAAPEPVKRLLEPLRRQQKARWYFPLLSMPFGCPALPLPDQYLPWFPSPDRRSSPSAYASPDCRWIPPSCSQRHQTARQ